MSKNSTRNTYLRLLSYLRPYWKRVVLLFICTTIFAALSGVTLTMIPPFLHILFSDQQVETVSAADEEGKPVILPDAIEKKIEGVMDRAKSFIYKGRPIDRLARFCVIFFVLMFVKNLFDYLLMYLTIYLEQSILHTIRNELYSKIHTLPMSFYDNTRTGHLISRITNDVNRLKGTVVYGLTSIVKNVLLTIIAISIIVYTSWKLSLLAVVLVPLNTILITFISRKLRKRSRRAQERMADMTSVLQETISGIRVVKAFGMEGFEKSKFNVFNHRYLSEYIRMMKFAELASPLSEMLGMMASVVLLWYGGRLVIATELDPANLMLFIVAMLWVVSPVKNLSKLNSSIQEGLASGERIFQILDIAAEGEVSGRIEIKGIKERIVYEDVCFSYENGPEVLSHIDLEIRKGEVIALVGPSGAGKSTLADLLPRFYSPVSGKIMIDGTDIQSLSIASLRSLMGIVTQETILFNDTVFNNIAYGLSDFDPARVEAAASAANAHNFIKEMPEGYNTVIGDRGVQLSGGQRQRLAIARALLKNPEILILDEATSSLDVESEALVQEAIERLVKGRTTLVIAHRLSTIKSADRIVVVEEGKIIQTGTHEELIGEEGTYRKLYHLQIRA